MSPKNIGTLYMYDPAHPGAHRAYRILATAALASLSISLAPNYVHGTTNKTPEFRAKFPTGQVPAFETLEGDYISEGSAIALYVATQAPEERRLIPKGVVGLAKVEQWQGFVDFAILPNLIFVYSSIAGYSPFFLPLVKAKLASAIDALGRLDAFLALEPGRKFLLGGERVSLADVAIVSGLVRGYQGLFDKAVQEQYPTAFKYTQDILAIPEIKSVYGDVQFAVESPLVKKLQEVENAA